MFRKIVLSIVFIVAVSFIAYSVFTSRVPLKVRVVINGDFVKPITISYAIAEPDEDTYKLFNISVTNSGHYTVGTLKPGRYKISLRNINHTHEKLFCINGTYSELNGRGIEVITVKKAKEYKLPDVIYCNKIKVLHKAEQNIRNKIKLKWESITNAVYEVYLNKDVDFSRENKLNDSPVALSSKTLKKSELTFDLNNMKCFAFKKGKLSSGYYFVSIVAYTNSYEYQNFVGYYSGVYLIIK